MERKNKQRLVATIVMMVVSIGCIFAQSNVKVNKAEADTLKIGEEYEIVDESPEFTGGFPALQAFLIKNLVYPQEAWKKGIEGKVLVQFVVAKDGSIDNVNIIQKVHPLLDAEAVRVVKLMPKWMPGKKNGKAVRVRFTLPVTFRIPKDDLKY